VAGRSTYGTGSCTINNFLLFSSRQILKPSRGLFCGIALTRRDWLWLCLTSHVQKAYIHTYTSEHKHNMCAGKAQTLSAKLAQLQALTKKIFPHGDLPSFWRKCAVFVTNGTSEPKGVLRCWDSWHPCILFSSLNQLLDWETCFLMNGTRFTMPPLLETNDDQTISWKIQVYTKPTCGLRVGSPNGKQFLTYLTLNSTSMWWP
jgi:hypothetical protein